MVFNGDFETSCPAWTPGAKVDQASRVLRPGHGCLTYSNAMLCGSTTVTVLQQGGGNAMLCATVEPPVRLSYDTSSVALKWQMCAISGHMCLSRLC